MIKLVTAAAAVLALLAVHVTVFPGFTVPALAVLEAAGYAGAVAAGAAIAVRLIRERAPRLGGPAVLPLRPGRAWN